MEVRAEGEALVRRLAVALVAIGLLASAPLAHAQDEVESEAIDDEAGDADEVGEEEWEEELTVDSLQDQLWALEDRLDRVERDTVLDRINFSGDYRTIFNAIMYTTPAPTDPSVDYTRRSGEIWSHRLRLGFTAQPHESVRITGRMTMYKLFGDGDAAPFIQDNQTTRQPRDSGIRVDQVWLDWFITDWLSFSAGRIAYSGGNPAELRENNQARQATWGLTLVDGEYDSVNLTFDFSQWLEGFYVRGFYTSWFNDFDDPFGATPFIGNDLGTLRIFGGNIDFSIPGAGRNFIQLGYYYVPQFKPFQIPIPNPAAAPDPLNRPVPFGDQLIYPVEYPDSLGTYQNASLLIEFYDIAGIGLDLFAAGALGVLDPNGEGIGYNFPDGMGGSGVFPLLVLSGTERADDPFMQPPSHDTQLTYFAYAGMRFTPPFRRYRPRIGFEFNFGSQHLISFATPTDQLITKLATRGKAYEAYLILPVNDHLFFRIDYVHLDFDYAGSGQFFGLNPNFNPDPNGTSTAPAEDTAVHALQVVLNAQM